MIVAALVVCERRNGCRGAVVGYGKPRRVAVGEIIFENNVVNEKWYTSDNNLLFTKTTTLNPDGSISEALV